MSQMSKEKSIRSREKPLSASGEAETDGHFNMTGHQDAEHLWRSCENTVTKSLLLTATNLNY